MILVDTSVWIDFLRGGDDRIAGWLNEGRVVTHPFVVGELACGNLRNRSTILSLLGRLHRTPVASHDEVLHFIEAHELYGRGLGYIDIHMLAATKLAGYARIETQDRALRRVARGLGLAAG